MPKSTVELNGLDSPGPRTPQKLCFSSAQCILPARHAIADPAEATRAMEACEEDPENNWFPEEDDLFKSCLMNDSATRVMD